MADDPEANGDGADGADAGAGSDSGSGARGGNGPGGGHAADAAPVEGTFLATDVDDAAAVLRDVERGRVHAVTEPPADLAAGEAVVGRVEPAGPMGVRWRLAAVEERFPVSVAHSDEPPTAHARDLAPDAAGDLVRRARAGTGEIHVLAVPEDRTDAAVADVLDDEADLRARAARLGVSRVEVRSEPGLVSVRYLP
ncbi:MAG: DUF5812 family protein [Haloferacaceae archaeon]